MKKFVKSMAALTISFSMTFSLAACGETTKTEEPKTETEETKPKESAEAKETSSSRENQRNGFDEDTNKNPSIGNIIIPIPEYFGDAELNDNKTTANWTLEDGSTRTAIFSLSTASLENTDYSSDTFIDEYMKAFVQSLAKVDSVSLSPSNIETVSEDDILGYTAKQYEVKGSIDGGDQVGTITLYLYTTVFLDTDDNYLYSLSLSETDTTMYSYTNDYDKIIKNLKINEDYNPDAASTDTETNASDTNETNTTDSSEVTPELKELLDGYEAYVDEYVEFLQKYNSGADTSELLGQYADMMSELSDWEQKVEDYDNAHKDSWSSADSKYYIEVTTRCSQKLLQAAADMSDDK